MGLILRLQRYLEVPEIWCTGREWTLLAHQGFRGIERAREFIRNNVVTPEDTVEILERSGGLRGLVTGGSFCSSPTNTKRCSVCGEELHISDFHLAHYESFRGPCRRCYSKKVLRAREAS